MWDNYPPGVSGNEYAIAGPNYEQEEDVVCEEYVDTVPADLLKAVGAAVEPVRAILRERENSANGPIASMKPFADLLTTLEGLVKLGEQSVMADGQCGYMGEALVSGYRGVYWWTCPACGSEHEVDR